MNGPTRLTDDLIMDDGVRTKTPSRKYIIVAVVIGFLATATIAFLTATIWLAVKANEQCLTEQCVKSAATYLNGMDKSIAPCDNFYEYACGGWVKQQAVPVDGSRRGQFSVMNDNLLVQLKDLIERQPQFGEPGSYKQARDLYNSCLDLESINSVGNAPVFELLKAVYEWPVLGNVTGVTWDSDTYDFELLWSLLKGQYGVDGVISAGLGIDDKNSNKYIIKIDQPSFVVPGYEQAHIKKGPPAVSLISEDAFPEEYGRNLLLSEDFEKEREAYVQYMVDIVVALGGSRIVANASMREVLAVGIEIEKFKVPKSKRGDQEELYNPTTLEELERLYPNIEWVRFMELLMPTDVIPAISTNETMIIQAPTYVAKLTDWLPSQSPRAITNFMVWQLVSQMVPYLGQTFIDIRHKYLSALKGNRVAYTPRWKACISTTNAMFGLITGRMYVDEHFPKTTSETAAAMVTNLQKAFKSILQDNVWLEEVDKTEAIEKVNDIDIKIGYPEIISKNVILDSFYNNIFIQTNAFFENYINFIIWAEQQGLSSYRSPVSRYTWYTGPAVVNAFYVPSQNSIQIPAGILQPPFLRTGVPLFSNYGGIGAVLGHELTHGFDNTGRRYDKVGNLRTWWSQTSIDRFDDRSQCIVDQYSDFVMPENGKHLNGNQTLGENIADIGGVKEAFKAYMDNVAKQQMLPAQNLTDDQMFFLSYAQVWCSVVGSEGADSAIKSDSHSPERFRVIGALQNNEEFSKAYNCPLGSYMNPLKKCDVW